MGLSVRHLAVASRELVAFARQAALMRHDVTTAVLPPNVAAGDDVVVCLHGAFATAGVLRPLRRHLERSHAHTATLTLGTGPGVSALAERLRQHLSELDEGARLHLLGHSLGGVVARYYAEHSGDRRVVQTVSLAAPFAGVPHARHAGFAVGRDLDPRSELLRGLRLRSTAPGAVPHLSVVARQDSVVRPPLAHALPGGEVMVIDGCGHNALLYDEQVAAHVARRIELHAAPRP